ncbi:AAA family ATPase [Bilophila wadsworthia]|uniref:AAA family ATPase n=1 Tax=Bilophila wadsworthia TaxID=35833 RepID=UPI003990CE2F
MAHSLYITGTEGSSGKTVVTLGLMHFLQSQVRKVAFFRPIIDSEDEARRDSSINLILKHFELDMLYRDTYACTYGSARTGDFGEYVPVDRKDFSEVQSSRKRV